MLCASLYPYESTANGGQLYWLNLWQCCIRMEHHIDGTQFFSKREAKARFRQHILAFWGNKCAYCREPLGRSGTLDHVRPKSKGGETRRSNLVACCYACNMSKGSCVGWHEWFRAQDFWEPHLEDAIHLWISQ